MYIITRTSNRPKYFDLLKKSIRKQNIEYKHVIVTDDKDSMNYINEYNDNHKVIFIDKTKIRRNLNGIPKICNAFMPHNYYFNISIVSVY